MLIFDSILVKGSIGIKLMLISDSTVLLIKNFPSNVNHKTKRVILVITLISVVGFSNLKSAEAIGTNLPSQQKAVSIMPDRDANRLLLIKPSKVKINSAIEPKIMMPSLSKNVKKPGEFSLPTYIYLMDDKFLCRLEVSSIIRELRGGSWSIALIGNMIFVAVLYSIWI